MSSVGRRTTLSTGGSKKRARTSDPGTRPSDGKSGSTKEQKKAWNGIHANGHVSLHTACLQRKTTRASGRRGIQRPAQVKAGTFVVTAHTANDHIEETRQYRSMHNLDLLSPDQEDTIVEKYFGESKQYVDVRPANNPDAASLHMVTIVPPDHPNVDGDNYGSEEFLHLTSPPGLYNPYNRRSNAMNAQAPSDSISVGSLISSERVSAKMGLLMGGTTTDHNGNSLILDCRSMFQRLTFPVKQEFLTGGRSSSGIIIPLNEIGMPNREGNMVRFFSFTDKQQTDGAHVNTHATHDIVMQYLSDVKNNASCPSGCHVTLAKSLRLLNPKQSENLVHKGVNYTINTFAVDLLAYFTAVKNTVAKTLPGLHNNENRKMRVVETIIAVLSAVGYDVVSDPLQHDDVFMVGVTATTYRRNPTYDVTPEAATDPTMFKNSYETDSGIETKNAVSAIPKPIVDNTVRAVAYSRDDGVDYEVDRKVSADIFAAVTESTKPTFMTDKNRPYKVRSYKSLGKDIMNDVGKSASYRSGTDGTEMAGRIVGGTTKLTQSLKVYTPCGWSKKAYLGGHNIGQCRLTSTSTTFVNVARKDTIGVGTSDKHRKLTLPAIKAYTKFDADTLARCLVSKHDMLPAVRGSGYRTPTNLAKMERLCVTMGPVQISKAFKNRVKKQLINRDTTDDDRQYYTEYMESCFQFMNLQAQEQRHKMELGGQALFETKIDCQPVA